MGRRPSGGGAADSAPGDGGSVHIASDRFGAQSVRGWAWLQDKAYTAVMVFADGAPLGAARAVPSPAARFTGRRRFRLDLPPNFATGRDVTLDMRRRTPDGWCDIGRVVARRPPLGEAVAGESLPLPLAVRSPAAHAAAASVAAIIATRDGAALLAPLLESILRQEPGRLRRIVVVDQASRDDTPRVARSFAGSLPVTLLHARPRASFAELNNAGARICDEDVLLFLNNDVVLTEPCIAALAAHLTADAGCVGLKLVDPTAEDGTDAIRAHQHVGVHFAPTAATILPFESRRLTDAPGAENAAIVVPAVTAAVLAIRRPLFRALGGFDERYAFGLEDVDLCLRSAAAGYRNVSVNAVSAVHIGSATRRGGRAATRRNRRNLVLFEARWDVVLRRLLCRDMFALPGFWTGRRLHVAVVPGAAAGDDVESVIPTIGQALMSLIPASVFVLRGSDRLDASQLDLILVADPAWDAGGLVNLPATAWLAAWVRKGDDDAWRSSPWREEYDVWFAEGDVSAIASATGRAAAALDDLPGAPSPSSRAAAIVDTLRRRAESGLRVALVPQPGGAGAMVDLRSALEAFGHTVRLAPGWRARSCARDHLAVVVDEGGIPTGDGLQCVLRPRRGGRGALLCDASFTRDPSAARDAGGRADAADGRTESAARALDTALRKLEADLLGSFHA